MIPPLTPPKPKRKYHLTRLGKTALRATIRLNKPWQHATGPRTPDGKIVSRQNALKHGLFTAAAGQDRAAFTALLQRLRTGSTPRPDPGPPID